VGFGPFSSTHHKDEGDTALRRIILLVAVGTFTTIAATLSMGIAGAQQDSSASSPDQPAISVSSISQDFGSVTVGTNSSPQTVTVTNTGNVPVNILLSFSEDNPPFNVTPGKNCQNLEPAQACQIQAVFHPRNTDPTTVIMTVVGRPVSGSLPDSAPQIVSLTGVGI
jgi:hypothetical protein